MGDSRPSAKFLTFDCGMKSVDFLTCLPTSRFRAESAGRCSNWRALRKLAVNAANSSFLLSAVVGRSTSVSSASGLILPTFLEYPLHLGHPLTLLS